jgi:RNA polymerase sigma factor (sigma-70 family)
MIARKTAANQVAGDSHPMSSRDEDPDATVKKLNSSLLDRAGRIQSDEALIASCLAGDDEAWELLVERYSSLVYSVARRYGLNVQDASDVHWQAWETLWEDLPRLRDRQRLGPWLITVTARLAWHHNDRRKRHPSEPLPDAAAAAIQDPAPQPEELAVRDAAAGQVRDALAMLPSNCQQLIQMLFFDPTAPSYDRIGASLGLSRDSIGSYRQRCLRKLREALETLERSSGGRPKGRFP